MKLNGPRFTQVASWPVSMILRAWMKTLNHRVVYRDPMVDPLLAAGPPRMYVFWHENILLPLYKRGNCHLAMLLSGSRDAELVARIADRFGFDCVRGSSHRGGARALRELSKFSRTHHLTITPDGPRGPRRKMAQGPIYLASKLGLPIVCLGIGYQHPWRMTSWDQFAVPKPFSRARAIISEAIEIPPELDRAAIEQWRLQVETTLNDLTEDAQDWANSGARRDGEQRVRSGKGRPPILPEDEADRAAA